MKSSNDAVNYQITGIRTGALFVVEPWDNVRGRNNTGLRAMGGLHAFGSDNSKIALSTVLGVGGSLPFIRNDTLESAVAVNVFWERDLAPHGGNHLLVTAGVNLFSFLSANWLPFIRNDTLESAVAVNVFWERDLAPHGGNHLLVTAGVNLFSFLSAN